MIDRSALAAGLEAAGADGWLLFDFHGLNPVAGRVLGIGGMGTRRYFVLLPRDGEPVAVAHRIELHSYEWPELRILVECGRGYYVRSLARDIGEALATGAYLTALRRTFVGPFTQAMSVAPDADSLPILPMSWLDERD